MKAQIRHKAIGIVFLVVFAGGFAQGAVINVPADFGTIQGAISDAGTVNGDEIVVAAGTYPEVIDFIGKAITVRSASGDPNDTIIDATGYVLTVVRCSSGEDPNTVLEGFTLTGGTHGMYNSDSSPTVTNCTFSDNTAPNYGGGMYNNNASSPTVTNCTFVGNSAGNYGGGMYNKDSSPTVTNCTFVGNSSSYQGGGMYNNQNSSPTVTNCTFVGNSASNGGGMYNYYSSPTLTNCTFSGNTATLDGGGMYNEGGIQTVTNCTFVGNTAVFDAGGIYNISLISVTLTNCIFSGNSAVFGGGMADIFCATVTVTNCTFNGNTATADGGGMYDGSSFLTVTNCIFSGNSAVSGGGMADLSGTVAVTNCTFNGNTATADGGGMYDDSSFLTVTNCIFWENSDAGGMDELAQIFAGGGTHVVNYSDIQGGWTGGGTGNLNTDPNFADADGADNTVGTVDDDFRLLAGSACIDAGDISVVTESTDRDGNPRMIDDPNTPDTGTGVCPFKPVDMGAYEFFIDDDDDDDTISNACDTCPGFDDLIDTDNDGYPNDCDACEGFDDDATLRDFLNSGGTDSDDDGIPDVCDQCILPGDINCDGFVDNFDLGIMAMHWLESTP